MSGGNKKNVLIACVAIILLLVIFGLLLINSKTYTIKIIDGDNSYVQKVKRNHKLTKPEDPKKEGYDFIGWYKDGKLYDFELKVKENFTIKAEYEKTKEEENIEEVIEEITEQTTTIPTNDVTTTKKNDKTTTVKKNTSNTNNNTTVATTRATAAPTTTTRQTTTTTTTRAVTYSVRRVPVSGSTIGQEMIYVVNNSTGDYVQATVTITYQNGSSQTVSIPASGKMVVGSTIQSITNPVGN